MKVGIFGGTFNPPHKTHIAIAKLAQKKLELDKLIVVPCGIPPHKPCDVDADTRLTLTKLAFGDFAEVSTCEMEKQGKSYTVETLRFFAQMYPQAQLYLIIGGDSFRDFDTWYCPREIASLATLAVADRNHKTFVTTARKNARLFGARTEFLDIAPDDVSSTEIRLRYQFGLDNGEFVSKAVDDYILQHGLYGEYREMAQKVRSYLTPQRFSHTFYVVKRGLELATEEEKHKVFVACLLHDCAKYIAPQRYADYGFDAPFDMPQPVIHSFLGALVAKKDFGVEDKDILDAIAYHTTGKPNMTRLQKIVYVADKTEQSRKYPLSHLTQGSLDRQFENCLLEANEVAAKRHGEKIYPLSLQTLDFYFPKKQKEGTIEQKSTNTEITMNETVQTICKALSEKSATDIKIIEVKGVSDIADYFVVCSGRSAPQVKAIAEHLEETMEKQDKFALHKEGMREGRWIALDYGDVIVHIFHKDTRDVYALDTLWNHGGNVSDYKD